MRLLSLTTALLSSLSVRALVHFTNNDFKGIIINQAFNLTWQGDGTPVTISLMNGPINNLEKVATFATSAIGAAYAWTPAATVTPGTYVLAIAQSGSTNYSPQFPIAAAPNKPAAPAASPAMHNTAGSSTTSPTLSSYPLLPSYPHPATGTWAAFEALAANALPPPDRTEMFGGGNDPTATGAAGDVYTTASDDGRLRSSTLPWDFRSGADGRGGIGLAAFAVAVAVGFVGMLVRC